MTRDDAIGVLRVMTAAWPSATLGDDTVELWIEYLASVGHDEGRAVASELVLSEQWLPTIARYRQSVVAKRRHAAAVDNYAARALPSGEQVTTPTAALAHIAALRSQMGVVGK